MAFTKAYVDSTGAGSSIPGNAMPDTNPACRTAFRCGSEIVRHPIGTLSGITPDCCPPSVRNPVRHGPERAVPWRSGRLAVHFCLLLPFAVLSAGLYSGALPVPFALVAVAWHVCALAAALALIAAAGPLDLWMSAVRVMIFRRRGMLLCTIAAAGFGSERTRS